MSQFITRRSNSVRDALLESDRQFKVPILYGLDGMDNLTFRFPLELVLPRGLGTRSSLDAVGSTPGDDLSDEGSRALTLVLVIKFVITFSSSYRLIIVVRYAYHDAQ